MPARSSTTTSKTGGASTLSTNPAFLQVLTHLLRLRLQGRAPSTTCHPLHLRFELSSATPSTVQVFANFFIRVCTVEQVQVIRVCTLLLPPSKDDEMMMLIYRIKSDANWLSTTVNLMQTKIQQVWKGYELDWLCQVKGCCNGE